MRRNGMGNMGSLRLRVPLLMFAILIVPLGLLGGVYYTLVNDDLGQIERSHAEEISASAHKLLDQLGEHLSSSVMTNANWEDNRAAVESHDIAWIEENINSAVDIIPNVDFVVTMDNDGNVLTQAGDVQEYSGKVDVGAKFGNFGDAMNVYGMVQTSRGLAVISVSKITNEEQDKTPTGLLLFGRLLDDDAMKGISSLLNAGIEIRSENGQTLASDEALKQISEAGAVPSGELPIFASVSRNHERFSVVTSAHSFLSGGGGVDLTVSVQAKASTAVQNKMVKLTAVAAVLALLLIVGMAVIIRRLIVAPLSRFDGFLGGVTAGNLSNRLPDQDGKRADEIGSIARSLQEMNGQLQSIVSGIRSTATEASSAAVRLSDDAEHAASGADEIAESMREVAAGADSGCAGMRRGAEVTLEISDSMATIGDRTSSVAAAAGQTTKQAEEGNATVRQAVEQMGRIAEAVEVSVSETRTLHDKSGRINDMVDAISAIAYRTNLLALNASIEASRAGEHGKGFAVVAEEVRKLAAQANGTASDITAVVHDIRGVIERVVGTIEQGNREVQSGTQLVREAGNAFRGIAGGIADMEEELREIASANQHIGERVEEMAGLVSQTEAISEASAERSQVVADIAESQMNTVRRVADAMGALTARIRDLELAVNRFKLQE